MRRQPFILAIGFAILVVIGAISITLEFKSRSELLAVEHTLGVLTKLSDLRLPIRNAESAARAFLLVGDQSLLNEYRKSVEQAAPLLAQLKTATADNAPQQQLLARVETNLVRRFAILDESVRLSLAGDREGTVAFTKGAPGRSVMASVDADFDRLGEEEQKLLQIRSAASRRTGSILLAVDLMGVALVLTIASISIVTTRRSNAEREDALHAGEIANARLEEKVAERTQHLRAAHEEIRRDATAFESIMASIGEAVMLVDQNGQIVYANRAYHVVLGTLREATTQDWIGAYELFQLDGVTPVTTEQRPIVRSLRGEQVDDYDLLYRINATDKFKNVMGSARPIRDAAGTQTGAVIVFRDVTEAKESERQFLQSQKLDALGQLTGGVAHDFNNILTVITGTSEMLEDGLKDRPKLLAIAQLMNLAADRGAALTQALLAFARKQPLQPRDIDVNNMVLETSKLLRPTLGDQIEIEAMLADDARVAHIDPSQLSTALLNLAINARDAMPAGGKLTLETSNVMLDEAYAQNNPGVQPGVYVMIAVSDTGTGIPADLRDKVFEPFFTTKEVGRGTGLGLSMVYGFVKQSGGHIKIYSEEGHGTTFKLYLPPASGVADAPPLAQVAVEGGGETILVVEDDVLVRAFVIMQLRGLGYATMTAANGKAALALVEGGAAFDLLFTDVIMAGMTGRQLADQVGKLRPDLKILYTSGYTEDAIVHHGRLDPGVMLLAKPYGKADLAHMIRAALDKEVAGAGAVASDHVLTAIRRQG